MALTLSTISTSSAQRIRLAPPKPQPLRHLETYRAVLCAADEELAGIGGYAEFGVFGGDRIAIARATLPRAAVFGFDTFTTFDDSVSTTRRRGSYESNINCALAITVRNLGRRGIDVRNPAERITFVALDHIDDWPGEQMHMVHFDRSFDGHTGELLDNLVPLFADRVIVCYDRWTATASDAHHDWLDRNPAWVSTPFATFQTAGRAFVFAACEPDRRRTS